MQEEKPLSHDAASQRHRLLEALRQRPVSTIYARKVLDIMSPAPRIMELRRDHNILTHWKKEEGHRIGEYVLLAGPQS